MEQQFTKEDVLGVEAKHITYVQERGGRNDIHVVKEIIHLKDKRRIPRIKIVPNYERDFYVDPIAYKEEHLRTYKEKRDYMPVSQLRKFKTTQSKMNFAVAKALKEFTSHPRAKQLARSPYLYGSDISSVALLKNDYRTANPDLISRNTVAGGDIETNVIHKDKDGQIICMSVTYKHNVFLAYLKEWVSDLKDPIQETLDELERIPELVTLKKARNLQLEILVVDTPAQVVMECISRLHKWQPDFFAFWNINFDMKRILQTLKDAGIDPADVFSDPKIPKEYKNFYYKEDEAMQVTASGVTKSKGPEDQWHWVTAPASFQCIDSMATYRVTRLAKGKESSYALDAILRKELSVDEEATIETEEDLKAFLKSAEKAIADRSGSHPYWAVANPANDTITFKTEVDYSGDELDDDEEDEVDETEDGEDIIPDYDDADDASAYYDLSEPESYQTEIRESNWEDVPELIWGDNVKPGFKVNFKLNFGKLKFAETDHLFGIEWHREMQSKHKVRYGLYNIIDSIRLEQLDEKINDLASSITLFSKSSDYKNFNSNPKRLCDDMHFWYLNREEPCVIGSSSDQMLHPLDQYVVGHDGWIVTLPSYMAGPNGLKCVKDFPNYRSLIFAHVADLDIVSTYPNVSQILNIARETTVMETAALQGVSDHTKRELGVNLTGSRTNAIEIAQKVLKAPRLDALLKAYLKSKGEQVDTELPK